MILANRSTHRAIFIFAALALASCDNKVEVVDTTLPEKDLPAGASLPAPIVAKDDDVEPQNVLPVELSAAFTFSQPAECIASGTLDKVYKKLDAAMDRGSSGLAVKLDEFDKAFAVSAKNSVDSDGAKNQEASVKLPENAYWNGLKISRVQTTSYAPPETDSSYNRNITFLEEPQKVAAALNRLGFHAKLAPEYSELMESEANACGGAMQVEPISGGARLSCGWGC